MPQQLLVSFVTPLQFTNFNYLLGCQLRSNRKYDLQNKLRKFKYFLGTTERTLRNKIRQETIFRFYEDYVNK
jgi:hypothetical protein